MPRGGTWGIVGGWGSKNFIFLNSTRFGVLFAYINCTCNGTIFWVPSPWDLGKGSKKLFSEHGHVAYQIKKDEQ